MSAKYASDESVPDDTARFHAGGCEVRHAAPLLVAGSPVTARNGAQGSSPVAPGRAVPADATQSVAGPSTGRESQRQQGEPGGVVAHVGPATPSHKTNAAGSGQPAASTPAGSNETREA